MSDSKRLMIALTKILKPYDHMGPPEAAAELLRLYIEAVNGFAIELIEEAASMLLRGEMPDHDGRFRPSPTVVAKACRLAAERRSRKRYLDSLASPRLPPPCIEKTAESRARVRRMVAEFIRGHGSAREGCTDEAVHSARNDRRKVMATD